MSPTRLRDDEQFVIEAVVKKFGGTWSVGGDPPDAVLALDGDAVGVEVTTLTQHITDDQGTRSRATDDAVISPMVSDLTASLSDLIPDGCSIGVVVRTPLPDRRKITAELEKRIRKRLSENPSFEGEMETIIRGNTIQVSFHTHEEMQKTKVWAVGWHRHSDANIQMNADTILPYCISSKAKKCAALIGKQTLWLALLNDYFLASSHNYEDAMRGISPNHPFEKILLVQRDGTVCQLY